MNLLLGWLAVAPSFAADGYLECREFGERSEAVAASRSARDGGLDARVVRRFESNGWRYLVVVDGVSDPQASASDLASSVRCTSIQAFTAEGEPLPDPVVSNEGPVEPPSDAAPDEQPSGTDGSEQGDVDPWVDAMWKAHGGAKGGAQRLADADAVRFEFRRTLPSGEVVVHVWARRGSDWVVQTIPKAGDVKASRLLVKSDSAWASIEGAPYTAQDLERTREIAGALAPQRVIPFVLTFPGMLENRTDRMNLELGEPVVLEGVEAQVLRYSGDRASESLTIAIDEKTGHVLRVDFGDGARVYTFRGWDPKATSKIALPEAIECWRGGELTDTVEALSLDLDPTLPQEWFVNPSE